MVGTVTDATGAVVSSVALTVVNIDTNDTRQVASDALGNYRFLFLPPGTYDLTAELESFGPPPS